MLTSSLLIKKRDGHALSDQEIRFLVEGFCSGEVADYQMSALAMAICIRGMDEREITTLTRAMLESGQRLPRTSAAADRPRVDKHSTGGLGDKVSLILAPLLAACGVDVPMISGRGLGITGGTLDKLESIDGYRTQLSADESSSILRDVGAFIVGATATIAPADRKLYALRDVTGTVESIPLITASILSKKLAANLDALVMDVKTGTGGFMKTQAEASRLADSLVRVGGEAGLPTAVILSDMDQPLGNAVGNAIEVNESLRVLQGDCSGGLACVRELTVELCAELLVSVDVAATLDDARDQLSAAIDSGQAMERFQRMVRAQGGRLNGQLPLASAHQGLAPRNGYIGGFDCRRIGEAVVGMGGGRRKTSDQIDPSVGIEVHGRVGDPVEKDQPIFTLYAPPNVASNYVNVLLASIEISENPVDERPLILARVGHE